MYVVMCSNINSNVHMYMVVYVIGVFLCLGEIYDKGLLGVSPSDEESFREFLFAAEMGHVLAQIFVGMVNMNGHILHILVRHRIFNFQR